jgi:hypothetical protein
LGDFTIVTRDLLHRTRVAISDSETTIRYSEGTAS